MNTTWLASATVPLWLSAAATISTNTVPETSVTPFQGRGLVRVQPSAADEREQTDAADDPAFDRDRWRKRLEQSNLDLRQRAFEKILEMAVKRDAVRDALEAWAHDSSAPELAWTARMALRDLELRREPANVFGSRGWGDFNSRFDALRQRFESLDPMLDHMQQDLERMFQQPHGLAPDNVPGASSLRSFNLQMNSDGVTCEVTEDVNGEKKTSTYKAGSVEELLAAHPELSEDLGQGSGFRFGMLPGGRGGIHAVPPTAPRDPMRVRPVPSGTIPTDVLGIECTKLSAEQLKTLGLPPEIGLHVERTVPGTIADVVGIQPGDLLIELNGTQIFRADDVSGVLKRRDPDGEVVVVLIDKKGQRRALTWKPPTAESDDERKF